MRVSVERRKEACLLLLAGEIDRSNMERLATALSECIISSPTAIVMDFEAVTFIDGGGLRLIHDALDHMSDGVWLSAAGPSTDIRRSLSLAGLTARPGLRLFASLDEALQDARAG